MSFDDISSRLKQAKEKNQPTQPERPFDPAESLRLRAKMLGVLIRDARLSAARTTDDCARLLKLPTSTIEAWEYGDGVPSLPQLELLAYYLDVPISHFWGQATLGEQREKPDSQTEYMQLRDRMIGALLRQAREAQGLALAEVAERAHISVEMLAQYEQGLVAIPMNELPVIANSVDQNIAYFLETTSYIGELLRIREEWKRFTDLDDEIREFAANPLNVGFIKIAITFSKMPVDELRKAAEGMLEIAM